MLRVCGVFLIKRFRYELNIKISDDYSCVMRGTATSSDTRQNEGPQVFVSQEYKRVSRRAVRCDTMSRLWRPPSPYLLRDVLFGEGLQCEKSIVLRNTTKSESINSQDVPEK